MFELLLVLIEISKLNKGFTLLAPRLAEGTLVARVLMLVEFIELYPFNFFPKAFPDLHSHLSFILLLEFFPLRYLTRIIQILLAFIFDLTFIFLN